AFSVTAEGRTDRTRGTGALRASRTLRSAMGSEVTAGAAIDVGREATGRAAGSSSTTLEATQAHATNAPRARKLFIPSPPSEGKFISLQPLRQSHRKAFYMR